ncbi:hypothetical protein L596_025202 [Steinernema carpocapsae]|uniref:Uncharacterized protein n=1 Tax=Steinernema carpocapsae TaxID=34508 RepID=A0A4U5M796_STECR|nr:hypothetical protein L596_025202 [Steinernema carpocapsae]
MVEEEIEFDLPNCSTRSRGYVTIISGASRRLASFLGYSPLPPPLELSLTASFHVSPHELKTQNAPTKRDASFPRSLIST